jgi:hypothetical protein
VVLPAATVTEAGRVADGSLLDKDTETPLAGAAPLKVTVPEEDVPLATLVGFSATDVRATLAGGVTVSATVLLTPLYVPVIVAETEEVTDLVVTVKVAVVAPAATVTETGTVAEALLLESATLAPPEGAVPFKVTVPVAEVPPVTLEGLMDSEDKETVADGVIVSAAVLLTPL